MNARIKELAEQAYSYAKAEYEKWTPNDGFSGVPHIRNICNEKFAELILADIDKLIDVVYLSYPLQQAVVCLDIDFLIKQHFYGTTDETSSI